MGDNDAFSLFHESQGWKTQWQTKKTFQSGGYKFMQVFSFGHQMSQGGVPVQWNPISEEGLP